jgi:hypothetical protein
MGSGFKTFTAASVLTAADLNNYCQTQSVMYFATTAARDTAITSPVDGMVAYIGSNDSSEGLYTYNGTSWRKGPGWNAPWGFINYAQTTSTFVGKNTSIVSFNASLINNRRYRFHGQIQSFKSTVVNDVAEISIYAGAIIAATRVTATIANFDGFGGSVVGYYTATSTASVFCSLYTNAVVGAGTHTFAAAASTPIFIGVEDIGPAGAPV